MKSFLQTFKYAFIGYPLMFLVFYALNGFTSLACVLSIFIVIVFMIPDFLILGVHNKDIKSQITVDNYETIYNKFDYFGFLITYSIYRKEYKKLQNLDMARQLLNETSLHITSPKRYLELNKELLALNKQKQDVFSQLENKSKYLKSNDVVRRDINAYLTQEFKQQAFELLTYYGVKTTVVITKENFLMMSQGSLKYQALKNQLTNGSFIKPYTLNSTPIQLVDNAYLRTQDTKLVFK